jgi:ComF family protein
MSGWIEGGLERLGGLLLPPRCVLCGDRGQRPCLDLCRDCEASLPVATVPTCPGPWPLGECIAPFVYAHPLDHLVHALKYRGQLAVGRVLGTLLGERVAGCEAAAAIDVLLPVPLHPSRHAARGFNQSAEIGRWVARRVGRPLESRLAARRRDTPPQVGLDPAQRRTNLAGAFSAAPTVRGRRVAIVDDVTTTGSTLQALAAALREAGAASVDAWCVARTDAHRIQGHGASERSHRAAGMR